jgi:hypothetical protein
MRDWQSIVVALVILAAAFYVGRRVWKRLRAFTSSRAASSCETGCGKCGSKNKSSALPANSLVYIDCSMSLRR